MARRCRPGRSAPARWRPGGRPRCSGDGARAGRARGARRGQPLALDPEHVVVGAEGQPVSGRRRARSARVPMVVSAHGVAQARPRARARRARAAPSVGEAAPSPSSAAPCRRRRAGRPAARGAATLPTPQVGRGQVRRDAAQAERSRDRRRPDLTGRRQRRARRRGTIAPPRSSTIRVAASRALRRGRRRARHPGRTAAAGDPASAASSGAATSTVWLSRGLPVAAQRARDLLGGLHRRRRVVAPDLPRDAGERSADARVR